MKVFIKGLNSCPMRRQNLHQYRAYIRAVGRTIVEDPSIADTIILWSCAFRGDVRDNSLSEIKRYKRDFKARIIIAGCLPDIDPELLKNAFDGEIIPWRDDSERLQEIFGTDYNPDVFREVFAESNLCDDTAEYRRQNPESDATFHDQFLKLLVSEGCRFNCSYCSEKLAFPPYRSYPADDLVKACRRMVEQTSKREVILIADSLGDYGCDIGTNLPSLIQNLTTNLPGVKFALGNLNPASFLGFFEEMEELLRNGHIRHLNLPIQSASNRLLTLMKRTYTKAEIGKIFGMLNSIGFTEFDTHLIIGFPSESDTDFEETMSFILHHRPKYVLASSYMESPRMNSAEIPDKVPVDVMRTRIRTFEERMQRAAILYNTDDSELSIDRLRRLNRV